MRPVYVYFICLTGLGALAQTTVEKQCEVSATVQIHVKNPMGNVNVKAWDKAEVQLSATLDRAVERLDFECQSDRVEVSVIVPQGARRGREASITLIVPRMCRLGIDTVSAPIRVIGVGGELRLFAVSGDVSVTGDADQIQTKTISGDIQLAANSRKLALTAVSGQIEVAGNAETVKATTISGDAYFKGDYGEFSFGTTSGALAVAGAVARADIETISGDIAVATLREEADLTTISGSIEAGAENLSAGEIGSLSGEITLRGSLAARCDLDLHSFSGDITLTTPAPPSASFQVSTFSGDIQNNLSADAPVKKHGPGRELSIQQAEAGGNVRLKTNSGDIRLNPL
ncbi:MAG: DUF4097 family beta strand repeat protein [Candidatus Hydrogenedentes bacterium]|nr:DUF4097 family beta strand repeat protein [Candidatus Hydrogenedentota bacterium]